ncbi:MAG: YmdB family metallophosphoesterase [Spirochaetales bacterium]|jgi:metallophosphoesterase (TIGR00282 family)|nr:YmdB family metallophosphoesterase [Spirochaetales bacterium]
MKILYVAELVGKAGIYCFKKIIPDFKKNNGIDFVIAGCDGATGGNGLGYNNAMYLRKLGADVLTMGECCFYKKDLTENFGKINFVLRPANLRPSAPGFGTRFYKTKTGDKIAVAVLLGQFGFNRLHSDNPLEWLDKQLERLRAEAKIILIDFHAHATAEKRILFEAAAGRCSAVIGSHTRVQTADEEILAGRTAVISDAGRTGSRLSVGGTEIESRIQEFLTGIPHWTKEAWDACELQALLLDIDADGVAHSIERVRIPVEDANPSGADAHSQCRN